MRKSNRLTNTLNQILSPVPLVESVNDSKFKHMTPKSIYLELGESKFKSYFYDVCSRVVNDNITDKSWSFELDKSSSLIEFDGYLTKSDDYSSIDYYVNISFSPSEGTIKVTYSLEYILDTQSDAQRYDGAYGTGTTKNRTFKKSIIISTQKVDMYKCIDEVIEKLTSDHLAHSIESEFFSNE